MTRLRVGFHLYHMSIRGTEVAVYDYANFNEILLHNTSAIFIPSNYREHRHFATGLSFDQKIDEKFRTRFKVYEYTDLDHLDALAEEFCDVFYMLKSGEKDEFVVSSIPCIVHCVFQCTESHRHGTVYAAISNSINKITAPVVPHICLKMPLVENDMRTRLGIPRNYTVIGSYGGYEVFDLDFVHKAIDKVVQAREDIFFVFMNIKPFNHESNVSRILFLPGTSDLISKAEFIQGCDAMIHGRSIGESFGMSIAEFTSRGKPIITWKHDGPAIPNEDTNHLDTLGSTGMYYQNTETLVEILMSFPANRVIPVDYSCLYNPRRVMKDFNDKLLRPALDQKKISIQVLCNWTSSSGLHKSWQKLLGNYPIKFTEKNPDYFVIINAPPANVEYDPKRTIVMGMEPDTFSGQRWQWYGQDKSRFMYFLDENTMNNLEWWLSLDQVKLLDHRPVKTKGNTVSAIVSDQYQYEGHRLRVDFCKYAEQNGLNMDVYGWNNTHGFSSYRGPLESKDAGLFPYKYTIAAENTSRPNYFTEKLVDAILSETLCFYWGCPNVDDFLDKRCYIPVDIGDQNRPWK